MTYQCSLRFAGQLARSWVLIFKSNKVWTDYCRCLMCYMF